MGSGRAIMQPLHTFCAEPLDPFGDGLRRRVELVGRVGLAQPTLDHASHHRLSTFGRQRRILVDVHLVSPWNTEASQPQLPRFRPDGQPPERPHLGRKEGRRMGVGIGLGCAEFPFSGAAAYWRWIDMCEAGGVDSIWQTDRIVGHQPFLESITTMAALAGRTRRMRFGMNVVSLAFRDPVLLAKQCATIDVLSEGRLLPAFAIGSPLAPEWQALGIDTKTRGRKTDECLDIIRRLWREESVDFSGAFYRL